MKPQILIVENGCQYTALIATALQELEVGAVILPPEHVEVYLRTHTPKGIILSGSGASVYEENAPSPPQSIFTRCIPILGICYGMQWIAHTNGGTVEPIQKAKRYGPGRVRLDTSNILFEGINVQQDVWESHGDTVTKLPSSYRLIGKSTHSDTPVAMSFDHLKIFALQFHPEVPETKCGRQILKNFAFEICGCTRDWTPDNQVCDIQERAMEEIGPTDIVIAPYSGGVDSSLVLALLAPLLGKRLFAMTLDGGQLGYREIEEIIRHRKLIGLPHHEIVEVRDELLRALRSIVDPQKKRHAFRDVYVRAITAFARRHGKPRHIVLLQGTLWPDRIESGVIKDHHNIGIQIPGVRNIHPLDTLFKYQVRGIGRALKLPPSITERPPSPGPGNTVRIVDQAVTKEKQDMVAWADHEVKTILRHHGHYDNISQLVVAIGCRSVGVKGSKRSYGHMVMVRPVVTTTFMTSRPYSIPEDVQDEIIARVTQHDALNRVLFDRTPKPPGTTEYE